MLSSIYHILAIWRQSELKVNVAWNILKQTALKANNMFCSFA